MEIWGITGLAGTGKTTAARHLGEKGCPTVDVDSLTRLAVDRNTEMGKEGFAQIYRIFGDSVLDRTGTLDRSALRKRIMTNPSEKTRLEAAIDPIVQKYVEAKAKEWANQGAKLAFVEGSRLVEAGYHNILKGIIQVTAPLEKRINRVAKRDSMGKQEVELMFQLQDRGEELMRRLAKTQWKNDGTQKAFTEQMDRFVAEHKG
ncbi:MAG: dephospho-CoA kinase [Bdellovibrionales bacterium]|nr:dephospho-CoA kinase [Bdellovibrionales bacterium]